MKLKELFCVLVMYGFNIQNLHWNATGINFDSSHKNITIEYYELFNKTIDSVAEMLTRMDINPPNYKEVFDCVSEMEKDYLLIDSNNKYNKEDVVKNIDIILGDVCNLILQVLDSEEIKIPVNIGIKSSLEAIYSIFDIEYRYINKRRF